VTGPTVGDEDGYIGEEMGHCTSLAWKNDSDGMLLLAAAFTHGMAVYPVSLPLVKDDNATKPIPRPTALTQLSQTHHSQGHARVRVAALVEFTFLNENGKELLKTVLLVWQWGYGGSNQ
jgi:hypothetical protein